MTSSTRSAMQTSANGSDGAIAASGLASDAAVVTRILEHIDRRTTDVGTEVWREPVANYRCEKRFASELALLRRRPTAFCTSASLAGPGCYVARTAAGTPILAVRGEDGRVRAFRNACRHRGVEVAAGAGCQKAFSCRYHGWTYAADGTLEHVPHERGFPGLDKTGRGLVPVHAEEARGIVFVSQHAGDAAECALGELPPLVPEGHRALYPQAFEVEVEANWKIVAEGFLEGYHIRTTHRETFYPLQYDNLNVVETFGDHSRIAFPFRAIQRQREVAAGERSADGTLTYVYHLFPSTMVATFPGRIFVVALEPIAIDRTRIVTYATTDTAAGDARAQSFLEGATQLVDAGSAEDREAACSIQRTMASGANEFFEFGLFESAIVQFHRTLRAALGEGAV